MTRLTAVGILLLFLALLVLQIQSYQTLAQRRPFHENTPDWTEIQFRVEGDILHHRGHLLGSAVAVIGALLLLNLPRGRPRWSVLVALVPAFLSSLVWIDWALLPPDAPRSEGWLVFLFTRDSLRLIPVSGFVCPLIATVMVQRETSAPRKVVSVFASIVTLWTLYFAFGSAYHGMNA